MSQCRVRVPYVNRDKSTQKFLLFFTAYGSFRIMMIGDKATMRPLTSRWHVERTASKILAAEPDLEGASATLENLSKARRY